VIALPALDLRDGACVQLVGGSYDEERIRLNDPLVVTHKWKACGFRHLHLVDLDGATSRGANTELMREILGATDLRVQVGGGLRTVDQIKQMLNCGAARVIVGTRAIDDPAWLAEMLVLFPDVVVVAADVIDRQLVTHGWTRVRARSVFDLIADLNGLPLGGLLVTAVHCEGRMRGTDLGLMEDVANVATCPVHAAGGIDGMKDLRALAACGIAGAIVGMALYTGAIDPRAAAEEFAE
jgi:phosphoribosylformimino-5-aminoimidazole carboxamide ribotide isomerase